MNGYKYISELKNNDIISSTKSDHDKKYQYIEPYSFKCNEQYDWNELYQVQHIQL